MPRRFNVAAPAQTQKMTTAYHAALSQLEAAGEQIDHEALATLILELAESDSLGAEAIAKEAVTRMRAKGGRSPAARR